VENLPVGELDPIEVRHVHRRSPGIGAKAGIFADADRVFAGRERMMVVKGSLSRAWVLSAGSAYMVEPSACVVRDAPGELHRRY
jgi:hypothetical protein